MLQQLGLVLPPPSPRRARARAAARLAAGLGLPSRTALALTNARRSNNRALNRQLANSQARFANGQSNAAANMASAAFLKHKASIRTAAQQLEADGVASGAAARHRKRGTAVVAPAQRQAKARAMSKRQSSATGYDSLSSYFYGTDIVYLMTTKIGTAAQSFTMGLDTGSADLWVYGSSISSSTSESTYNPAKSTTSKTSNASWSITYGKGSEAGVIYQDLVAVGGYSVANQSFAMANQVSDAFSDQPISGLFGFAFGALSGTGSTPFFESLIAQGTLTGSQQYFSVFLNRASLSTTNGAQVTGGELCLGCMDSTKYTGTINYVPVASEGYWTVQADAVSLNGASVAGSSFYAALDTGSSIITLPTATAKLLYKALGATAASSDDGYYVITCSAAETVDVGIVLGGIEYKIAVDDLILGYVSSADTTHCVLAVVAGDNVDFLGRTVGIVGDTFLKNVFSVFTYSENGAPAVGLAPSSNAPSGSGSKIGSASSAASSAAATSSTSTRLSTSAAASSDPALPATASASSSVSASASSAAPVLATVTVSPAASSSAVLSTATVASSSVVTSASSVSVSSISFMSAQTVAVATPSVSYQTSFVTVDPPSSSGDDSPASVSPTASSQASGAERVGARGLWAAAVGVVVGAVACGM